MLAFLEATTLFADWPRPPCGGRDRTVDGSDGAFFSDDADACWLSLDGDTGRCGGERLPPSLGEVIREDVDTVEAGRGGK